jgi:hypothetical protein
MVSNDGGSAPPARGASKLSLLISFVAGAVACYLFLFAYGAFNPPEPQSAPQPSPTISRINKPVQAGAVPPGGATAPARNMAAPKPAHP